MIVFDEQFDSEEGVQRNGGYGGARMRSLGLVPQGVRRHAHNYRNISRTSLILTDCSNLFS